MRIRIYSGWIKGKRVIIEAKQLPFQFEDKDLVQNLLKNVSDLLKDSDAEDEKKVVKDFLQRVSVTMTFVALGDAGVGKTTFLDQLFEGAVCGKDMLRPTRNIRETLGGAQEMEFLVSSYHCRHFITDEAMQGISIVDIQGLDTLEEEECIQKIKFFVKKSDVLFVVFDVLRIRSFSVWDFLEEIDRDKFLKRRQDFSVRDNLCWMRKINFTEVFPKARSRCYMNLR